ncbi:MAG: hypothetical protein ACFE94_12445 [Candidatus Hodarchaeota archaeon]
MNEIKNLIEDLGIAALEANTKIARIAVVSDSGNIIFQTENFDLTNQTKIISDVIKGIRSFVFNNIEFSVDETNTEGIIGTNDGGMGHLIFIPFQGGVLVAYAMPKADPMKALLFLKDYASKLNGKI